MILGLSVATRCQAHPSQLPRFNRGRHLGFCVEQRRSLESLDRVVIAMLDAISLSEEELKVLFGSASNGATSTAVLPPRKSRSRQPKKTKATANAVPARCGYRTGKCQNLQAFKRNGKLHKLCEFHRERANFNQKKLDQKKRMQRSKKSVGSCASVSSASSVTSEDDCSLQMDGSPRTVEAAVTSSVFIKTEGKEDELLPASLDEAPLVLGCEELEIFCSLMTVDIRAPRTLPPTTPSCHYYTSAV
ncbi:hypothetical protein PHMEG_00022644 [Phytophthora megakarya]|uniref:Uncharacterized protein n=1 Tax=Phytophthora megakarya TaxID=4795 RepID=A0A225VI78_9STRA|nr:hypothetical protein PHMEG_00022644 [Phytophthora megakarya]